MAYIVSDHARATCDTVIHPLPWVSVNGSIISDSGDIYVCPTNDLCIEDPVYLTCVEEVRRELITTTAAIFTSASATMGLVADLPVGLAPGLGLNSYVSTSAN